MCLSSTGLLVYYSVSIFTVLNGGFSSVKFETARELTVPIISHSFTFS
jgi:hypothetical protein